MPPNPGLIAGLTAMAAALWVKIGPIWHALPMVPQELGRAAGVIVASSATGFVRDLALAFAGCALICIAASLPHWYVGARARGAEQLDAIMARFGADLAGAVAACLVAVVLTELIIDLNALSGQFVRATFDLSLLYRLAAMVPAVLFRPGEPKLRLLRAHDRQIAAGRPWALAAVAFGLGFPTLIPVWLAAGMNWFAGQALAVTMGLATALLGLGALWRFLSPIPGAWLRWRHLALAGTAAFWLAWSYGVVTLDFPFFFAVVWLGAVLVSALIVDRFIATALRIARMIPPGSSGTGEGGFWLFYGGALRRSVYALASAGIVIILIDWAAQAAPLLLGIGRLAALRANAVEALVLLLAGYFLFEGSGAWLRARFDNRPQAATHTGEEDEPPPASRLSTVMPVAQGFLGVLILGITLLLGLSKLGLDTTPLIAGAGIFGLAISFGSQSLVRDVVAGIFFLADDAFRLGEYIETGRLKGSVERISLRSIRLRHQNGQIHTLPFGQLGSVTNFSRDWVTTKFNLRLARDVDIETVRKTVKRLGQDLLTDPELGREFLQPLKLQGVADIQENAMVLRFKFTVRPGKPTVVHREALKRIVWLFAEKGIHFATNTVIVESREEDDRRRQVAASQNMVAAQPAV